MKALLTRKGGSAPWTGSRGDAAGIMGAGIAAIVAWVWFPYLALLVAGVVVTVMGGASFIGVVRRGRAWHQQDMLLRRLWAAVKLIPPGYVLTDPDTGELLTAERERGWLTLAVTDPPLPGRDAAVTRYMIGRWAAPERPPLFRHMAALDGVPPARWRFGRQAWLTDFNARVGALKVSTEEISGLLKQIYRAAPHSG